MGGHLGTIRLRRYTATPQCFLDALLSLSHTLSHIHIPLFSIYLREELNLEKLNRDAEKTI